MLTRRALVALTVGGVMAARPIVIEVSKRGRDAAGTPVDYATIRANVETLQGDMARAVAGNPEAWQDVRGKPDGALTVLDSGQPWHLVQSDAASTMKIVGGAITNTATTGMAAGYAEVQLAANVTRIGATIRFAPGTTSGGSAAIVIWQTEHISPGVPNSPLHLTVTPERIAVDIWVSGTGAANIGAVYFDQPLKTDGTEYTVDARIVGTTIEAAISNGTRLRATDSRVASYAGPWACWETFNTNSATDARAAFVEVWADTQPMTDRARETSLYGTVEAAERVTQRTVTARQYAPATAVNLTLSGTTQELSSALRLPVVFPASGKVLVRYGCYVAATGSRVMLTAYWDAAKTSQAFSHTLVNGTYTGTASGSALLSYPEGTTGTLHITAWIIGGSASVLQDGPNGYVSTVSAEPVV